MPPFADGLSTFAFFDMFVIAFRTHFGPAVVAVQQVVLKHLVIYSLYLALICLVVASVRATIEEFLLFPSLRFPRILGLVVLAPFRPI